MNKAGGQGAAAIERVVYDHDTNPYLVAVREPRAHSGDVAGESRENLTCSGSTQSRGRSISPTLKSPLVSRYWSAA